MQAIEKKISVSNFEARFCVKQLSDSTLLIAGLPVKLPVFVQKKLLTDFTLITNHSCIYSTYMDFKYIFIYEFCFLTLNLTILQEKLINL